MAGNAVTPARPAVRRWLVRGLTFVCCALALSWVETRVSQTVHRQTTPAGLGIGLVDGALMPLALPVLLAGKDVPIYARNNTGRAYHLGYTSGVTLCGAVFFGVCFSRLSRWRAEYLQSRRAASTPGAAHTARGSEPEPES